MMGFDKLVVRVWRMHYRLIAKASKVE